MADQPEGLLDHEIDGALAAARPDASAPAVTVEPPADVTTADAPLETPPADSVPAASTLDDPAAGASTLQPFHVDELQPNRVQRGPAQAIDLLRDVELDVKIELGRSRMLVEDVLRLGEDSVVELDKLAGDPVDVFVNGRLVARGEVLVLNDNFCVRISDIIGQVEDK
jgi:flagellar motor switch protein FliN